MAWPFLLVLIRYKYLRFQNIFQCLFCCSSFVWKFIFPSSSPLAFWAGRVKSSPRVRPHSPVGPARRPRAAAPTGSARGAAWGRPHPQTPGTEPSHTDQPAKNPYYEKGKNWCVLYLTLWLLDRRSIFQFFLYLYQRWYIQGSLDPHLSFANMDSALFLNANPDPA